MMLTSQFRYVEIANKNSAARRKSLQSSASDVPSTESGETKTSSLEIRGSSKARSTSSDTAKASTLQNKEKSRVPSAGSFSAKTSTPEIRGNSKAKSFSSDGAKSSTLENQGKPKVRSAISISTKPSTAENQSDSKVRSPDSDNAQKGMLQSRGETKGSPVDYSKSRGRVTKIMMDSRRALGTAI